MHKTSEKACTRSALIEAGIDLFGEQGFAATTTRMLANHATTNIASITYHFGSKEGLYHAVMEHILLQMQHVSAEPKQKAALLQKQKAITPAEALTVLESFLMAAATLFTRSDEPRRWMQIIIREQAHPTAAFDILYDGHFKPMNDIFSMLIAAYIGKKQHDDEVKFRAHMLLGQLLIFVINRESMLRHLGVKKLMPRHVKKVKALLLANTKACLNEVVI